MEDLNYWPKAEKTNKKPPEKKSHSEKGTLEITRMSIEMSGLYLKTPLVDKTQALLNNMMSILTLTKLAHRKRSRKNAL